MEEGQLLLCSFSSVDIGFRSKTFAVALNSLEVCIRIYQCKIRVRDRNDYYDKYLFFFFFFVGWGGGGRC